MTADDNNLIAKDSVSEWRCYLLFFFINTIYHHYSNIPVAKRQKQQLKNLMHAKHARQNNKRMNK